MAVPAPIPVTAPVGDTEATVAGVMLHTPPGVGSVKEDVVAIHRPDAPTMAAGEVLTVTALVAGQPGPEV